MEREPLPENYRLVLSNGNEYIIKKQIAEGGFSLVYDAKIAGGTTPMVIKEYFPRNGAFRNSEHIVCPLVNDQKRFDINLKKFQEEGQIGGKIAQSSYQTLSFLSYCDGYALMKKESEDMMSVDDLVTYWSKHPPLPDSRNPKDADPVFTDFVRLKYSLRVIDSLLTVIVKIHRSGYLHLDISSRNVIVANPEPDTGHNCTAFIADYGYSVPLSNGVYQPSYPLSYSPGFAAPEIQRGKEELSCATDIYSIGMLLFFMCVGDHALDITRNRKQQVSREIANLKIPQRHKNFVIEIICKAVAEKTNRYQSAEEMQTKIRELSKSIPLYPINSDNTRSFTLYSLKSMLEGSMESHYSWAHEMCDRRNMTLPPTDDAIYEPLTSTTFSDNRDFLEKILPKELFDALINKTDNGSIQSIMSGNYPKEWKAEIRRIIQNRGTRRLIQISRTRLDNEFCFGESKRILFEILGEDGQRVKECWYQVANDINQAPYVGLAILILYALLGSDGFSQLIPSPQQAPRLFFPI